MKPLVVPPDAERVVRDVLVDLLGERGESATVGVGVPRSWTPSSGTHVQVSTDGTPSSTWPVKVTATVRITVWSAGTSEAKRLAGLCMGLLLAYSDAGGMAGTRYLTGVVPTRDPDNGAELAYITVGVTLRLLAA